MKAALGIPWRSLSQEGSVTRAWCRGGSGSWKEGAEGQEEQAGRAETCLEGRNGSGWEGLEAVWAVCAPGCVRSVRVSERHCITFYILKARRWDLSKGDTMIHFFRYSCT